MYEAPDRYKRMVAARLPGGESMGVANRYDPAVPSLEQFLGSVGRGKFVRPLYTALAKDKDWGLPIAKRTYAANRASYHPQVQDAVDKLKIGS